jgi:hypothetical protein
MMISHIQNFLFALLNKIQDLGLRPSLIATQKPHGCTFNAIEHIPLGPNAESLLLLALGPRTKWPSKTFVVNIYETGVTELISEFEGGSSVDARFSTGGRNAIAPFAEGNALLWGVGFADDGEVKFLGFEIAARPEMVEGLAKEIWPVFEGQVEHTAVDVVEATATSVFGVGGWKWVGPFGLDVIDLELAVGWHPAGLDRREVDSSDGCGGVLISELNGPDSGTGAEVEDGVGGWWDGGEGEGTVEREAPEMVLKV